MGAVLVRHAEKCSRQKDRNFCRETSFLGIEKTPKYVRLVTARLDRLSLKNVRIVREHAGYVIRRLVPAGSVAAYHIYFPDPWPKRRHHKRRLINPEFAEVLFKTLEDGGMLHIATDHSDYFEWILEALESVDRWSRKEVRSEEARGPDDPEATHYEAKYSAERRIIHRLQYQKAQ